MSRILDEVMDLIEQHGWIFAAILIDKDTSSSEVRQMIPSMRKVMETVKDGNH